MPGVVRSPCYPQAVKRLAVLLILAAFVMAACGDTSGPLASRDPGATSTPAGGQPTKNPVAPPTEIPTDAPTDAPTAEPTTSADPTASIDPTASATPAPDAACSGSDANRAFFASAAADLAWDVYCAVLPSGWFVQSGQYRQGNGGFLEVAYRGPDGRTFALREGAFCGLPDGCVPAGSDAGTGAFGDREGMLIMAIDGSFAVVVDKGAPLSWLALGAGMDQAEFLALSAALSRVGR